MISRCQISIIKRFLPPQPRPLSAAALPQGSPFPVRPDASAAALSARLAAKDQAPSRLEAWYLDVEGGARPPPSAFGAVVPHHPWRLCPSAPAEEGYLRRAADAR